MIKLHNILFEQPSGYKRKLNVLFITDYPAETIGNYATRLIATEKVTGEIKSYSKQSSEEMVSLLLHNITTKFDLVVIQVSGLYDKSGKELLTNLYRAIDIAKRRDAQIIFIATPTTRFIDTDRNLDYVDNVYDIISKYADVITLPEVTDDDYFTGNGSILNKAGNLIIYDKLLTQLKSIDTDIEIDPTDTEEPETGETTDNGQLLVKRNKIVPISANREITTWEAVMKFLIDKGLTVAGAAGVAGNIKIESDFNTGAIGDKGTSYGLCQWHLSRKDELDNFAQEVGGDVSDPQIQLDFLWQDLNTSSYSNLLSLLQSTDDPREAAQQFGKQYERPAIVQVARLDYAEQFATEYDPGIINTAVNTATNAVSGAWNSLKNIATGIGVGVAGAFASGNKQPKVNPKNGNLTSSELKSIGGSNKLAPMAASAYLQMKADYEKENPGKTFRVTDSYRPYNIQNIKFDWDLYNSTGKKKKIDTNGTIDIAYPGTSNHGWGKAIDLFPAHAQNWVKQNGMKYGWSWEEGRSVGESWHFTYVK